MRLLRAATLVTPDPAATARLYATWFDYRLIETGTITTALARSWGLPDVAGTPYTVCAPASGAPVYLRFIAGQTPAGYQPLRSYGWAAIELCVQDVRAVHDRLRDSPFDIIGPPKALDGMPAIWPMQVRGPDDEIVFLTEIRADPPGQRLPRARSPIDALFIAVLACSNLAASKRWFADLDLTGGADITLAYTMLSRAFGLPPDHRHRIAVLTHANDVALQLDQYPPPATPRPRQPGAPPPGIALATLLHPSFDTLPDHWISPPAQHDGILYAGTRSATLIAPDGTLVELMQHDTSGGVA